MTTESRLAAIVAFALAASFGAKGVAGPLVIDEIVAVVDDSPILLSELEARAKPFLQQLKKAPPPVPEGAERELERELLAKMIDERLFAADAARKHVTVTDAEVLHAKAAVAAQQKVTEAELLAEAAKIGIDAASYASILRAQLLEGKLLSLAFAGKPRPEGSDREIAEALEKKRAEMLAALRAEAFVEVRR